MNAQSMSGGSAKQNIIITLDFVFLYVSLSIIKQEEGYVTQAWGFTAGMPRLEAWLTTCWLRESGTSLRISQPRFTDIE